MQTTTIRDEELKTNSPSLGLVIAYFGNTLAIETLDDKRIIPCHIHRNQILPVVGDIVNWQIDKGEMGTVTAIQARESVLARGDAKGKWKPIAANVDCMFIVMSPLPIFSEYLIDRYLIAAEILKIRPIIVLNKSDLLKGDSGAETKARLQWYTHIPYTVLYTSIYDDLSMLNEALQDETGVLVGPSGVGKSSLISKLALMDDIKVGEVSSKGTGKHTTTATRLYHLKKGGRLIDSPGVREFSLWNISKSELLLGFVEFRPFMNQCKFRDCSHIKEPNCAVQDAVKDAKISPSRYASYISLLENINHQIHTQYD